MNDIWKLALVGALLVGCKSEPPVREDGTPTEQTESAPMAHDQHHGQHGQHAGGDHQHATSQHRFEDAEKWAEVFDDPERDAWQKPDEVVTHMNIEPGMTIADIGAGTGYFLGRLSKAVGPEGRVHGLDVEQSMADHMTKRAQESGWTNVEARAVAPDDPALGSQTMDRILIVDTWHHISDRAEYAKKLAASLKPGGQVVVVDFDPVSRRGPPREHKLASDVVIQELTAGGLQPRVIEETLPDQYIVIAELPAAGQ